MASRCSGADSAVRAGSQAMRMRPVIALAPQSSTPGSRRRARSISQAQAAQRMPSVSRVISRPPSTVRLCSACTSARSHTARSGKSSPTRPAAVLRRR